MKARDPVLKQAIKDAGGQSKVARDLGIKRQAVNQWEKVPLRHLKYMAQFAPRKLLRPDLYD